MTTLAKGNGTRGLSRIAPGSRLFQSPFDHFFDDFWGGGSLFETADAGTAAMMRIDVRETDDELRVQAEVPGVDPEHLDVTLNDDVLSLSGEKMAVADDSEGALHYRERSFGKFRRDIRLPYHVDPENMQATYRNGLLEVTLRKAPEHRPQKIKVKVK